MHEAHGMQAGKNAVHIPVHAMAASPQWLHEYPTIPLYGHSHTDPSLPVQFRSLMTTGKLASLYPARTDAPMKIKSSITITTANYF